MRSSLIIAGSITFSMFLMAAPAGAQALCVDCIKVRVGPAEVVRGPFPDELDATFAALQLDDGSFRGFSANGSTYAIEGATLWDMDGERREVLQSGPAGSVNECGRWLTSVVPAGDALLGFVHQESICRYGAGGQTDKTMAIATSSDNGLTWTDLGTVISGADTPLPGNTSGEGDCGMVDGLDGYLYGYCLRNIDYKVYAARAPIDAPTEWHKFFEGSWTEPGLDGEATAIGFIGTGVGYLSDFGAIASVATDPWFGGLRLSLSTDKISFIDLKEPLLPIDGSDWNRPADTDLIAYSSILDADTGSNAIDGDFLLSYIYIPPGEGFESRYLVHQQVSLSMQDQPLPVQAGLALTRWVHPEQGGFIGSTGPLTGDRQAYKRDAVVAHMLTRPPETVASIKFAECSRMVAGRLDHLLADEGSCAPSGYQRERTSGWLYAAEQADSVPVYRCMDANTGSHFVSIAADCDGLGRKEFLLGYGLAP